MIDDRSGSTPDRIIGPGARQVAPLTRSTPPRSTSCASIPYEWRDDRDVREILTAEQAEVLDQVGALSRSMGDIIGASESANADDEHDPEGSTIAFERAQVAALLAQARAHLTEG